jgi:outer membrane putative beta-barrel porin/alpha-amylase
MTRTVASALTALLVLAMISVTPAWAGRPLDTEDTGTMAGGRAEVELGVDHTRDGDDSLSAGRAVIAVGLGDDLELRLESALAVVDHAEHQARAGIGDALFGAKYRLRHESPAAPAVLVALAVRLPTGDADRGLGSPGADVTMLAVVGKSFGPVTVHGNAGYTIVTDDRSADVWRLAASAEWATGGGWTLVAEIVSDIGATSAPTTAVIRAGARFDLSDVITIDGAAGVGLTRSSPDLVTTVGLTLRF